MSPGRAEAHAEDARSALTRRLARSYLRPDIAPSHRACAVHSRESTSVPSRLSSAAPPLSAEPTGLNPPTPVSGEPIYNDRLRPVLLINRRIVNTAIGRDVRGALSSLEIPVLVADIAQRVVFAEALADGQTVVGVAPKSLAARELDALVDEIMQL